MFLNEMTELEKNKELNRKFQLLSDCTSENIIFTDCDGKISDVNHLTLNTYGYSRDEMLNMNIKQLRLKECRDSFDKQIDRTFNEVIIYDSVHINKNGSIFPVNVRVKGNIVDSDIILAFVICDISESKKHEEKLVYRAEHDFLTEIPNRRQLVKHLKKAIEVADKEHYKLALMFFDLDKFKLVNDKLGHLIGDNLLKGVAKRMKKAVRKEDFIARFGGDEFILVQSSIRNELEVMQMAERVLNKITFSIELSDFKMTFSTSIGISIFPDDAKDIDTLIKNADTAMYQAKEKGGGTYLFFSQCG